ncbi:MAG: hypothetical protein WC091_11725 [Sulfuricellaceae bacterium]
MAPTGTDAAKDGKQSDKFNVLLLYYGPADKVFALIFKQFIDKMMKFSDVFLHATEDGRVDWSTPLIADIRRSHLILILMSPNIPEDAGTQNYEAGILAVLSKENKKNTYIIKLDGMCDEKIPLRIKEQGFSAFEYDEYVISRISQDYNKFVNGIGICDSDFSGDKFFKYLNETIATLTGNTYLLRSKSLGNCGAHVIDIIDILRDLQMSDDKLFDKKATSVKSMQYHFIENRLTNVLRDLKGLKTGVLPVYRDLVMDFWRRHIMGRIEKSMRTTNVAPTEGSYGRRLSPLLLFAQGKAINRRGVAMTRVFSYSLDEIIDPDLSKSLLDLMTVQKMIGVNVSAIFEENFKKFEETKLSILFEKHGHLKKELKLTSDTLDKTLSYHLPGCDYMILDEKAVYLTRYKNNAVFSTELITEDTKVKAGGINIQKIRVKAAILGMEELKKISQDIEVKLRLSERCIGDPCFVLGVPPDKIKNKLSERIRNDKEKNYKYDLKELIKAVGNDLTNCGIAGDDRIKFTQAIVAKSLVTVPEFAPCFKIFKKDTDFIHRLIFDGGRVNNDQKLPDIFTDFGGKDQESVLKIFHSWSDFLSYLGDYQIKPDESTGKQWEKKLAERLMKRPGTNPGERMLGEMMFVYEKEVPLSNLIENMASQKQTTQENKLPHREELSLEEEELSLEEEEPSLEEIDFNGPFSLEHLWACVNLTKILETTSAETTTTETKSIETK